jgi:hypothetical protein
MDNNDIPTSVEELWASRLITIRLYNGLRNFGIDDIRELEGVGIKTLRLTRGWGKGMIAEISALAEKAGVAI